MIASYPELRDLALSLALPRCEDSSAYGRPCVKAHGRMWAWWSPYLDAAVFHSRPEEREMLLAADPDTFALHPHYAAYPLILVRAGRIEAGWAAARLRSRWRETAPKRWLKDWEAGRITE